MGYNINKTFYEYWHDINKDKSNFKALEYFGNSWTFAETEKMMFDYAKAISHLDLKKGDTITICSPLIPSTIAILYATNMLGITVNLISPELLSTNPQKYLDETDTNTLVILDKFYSTVAEKINLTETKNVVVTSLADDAPEYVKEKFGITDFFETYKELPKDINYITKEQFLDAGKYSLIKVSPLFVPNSTAVVLYTGGSTGVPKGVELINEAINIMAMNYSKGRLDLDYVPGDRNMLLIPPNHPTSFIHGLTSAWACQEGGITQVCQPIYNLSLGKIVNK